ncbi:hypothetical protein, partial [Croceicoccus hydrothermalis]|uniref:hypothetical protein n=1 Tax=Croceicoccus hydrothermalis TaxID=2867964 RepID=UPI001EFAA3BE
PLRSHVHVRHLHRRNRHLLAAAMSPEPSSGPDATAFIDQRYHSNAQNRLSAKLSIRFLRGDPLAYRLCGTEVKFWVGCKSLSDFI